MAKFLNTSATTYLLEELIKGAQEKLILISPFLKINSKIKELLEDKNRMKIDIRIVYGKSDLQPTEIKWLEKLEYIRLSYCENLHAKCYLSELSCIITSLNLYEFSQINNNEMGIFIERELDQELYTDALKESQRIIRISEEVKLSLSTKDEKNKIEPSELLEKNKEALKLTTSNLAKKLNLKTQELLDKLVVKGYLKNSNKFDQLTELGKEKGGEFKSNQFGGYYLWPDT